jgi:tetraacyldisaccharide 4'-kinase
MVAPTASGDELALMARRLPAAIVVANGNRSNGIQTARNLGAEIVCLDDALHHPIAKDCDLIVMHADELHQNHLMFPLGRLRYPLTRLRHAHGLVIVFPSHSSEEDLKHFNHPKWVPEELPIIKARIQPDGFFDSKTHCEVEIPFGKPVAAWAAIANPERFFETLRRLDCQLTGTLACPDHQPASPRRLFSWAQAQKARGAKVIVCTEKDAMHQLPELCLPMIYLRMDLEFPEGRVQLDRILQDCLDAGFQRCQSL